MGQIQHNNQPVQMKGVSQGWMTTKVTYATGVFKGGSQGLAEEMPGSVIDYDNIPTTIRTTTALPHHLCCYAAIQVVATGPG